MKKIPVISKILEKKVLEIENEFDVNQTKNNKLIVVLGMHRSGTSAISAGMQVLGVEFGDRLLPPVKGDNDKGYWEDIDLCALNVKCLNAIDQDWNSLSAITANDIAVLKKQGYFLNAVNLLRQKVRMNAPIFGFKDPRVAKLFPFWKQAFDRCKLDVNYVLVIRNPLSVVKSLIKRNDMFAEQCYFLWVTHIITSMVANSYNSCVVVDYDRMMQSPDNELNRIATAFDLKIDQAALITYKTEFLDNELRHTIYELDDLFLDDTCPPIVTEIYKLLLQIASDKSKFGDIELCSDIERWKNEFERLKCPLILVDTLIEQKKVNTQILINSEEQNARLSKSVVDKDQHIFILDQVIEGRDGQITSLNQALSGTGNFTPIKGLRRCYGAGAITSNFAAGDATLIANTTGTVNTAVGVNALQNNTTGDSNTANGGDALLNNTTGIGNTASGVNALRANTTGIYNTANGGNALFNNTTGYSNTASGVNALSANTTGIYNTASGWGTLGGNTTGAQNTATGVNTLLSNTTGYNNTASGMNALLENTTGYDNTAVGNNALRSNSDTYHNVAIGSSALMASISDLFNTAIGTDSLKFHNGGNRNTGCGYATLFNHLTGDRNTAIGCDALYTGTSGNDNTAVGNNALYTNLSGSSNTAVGAFANTLATGSRNTSIGYEAGSAITTGSYNVVIGGYTGSAPPISFTGSNNIVISDGAANIRAYYTNATSLWTIPNDMAIAGKFYKSQPAPTLTTVATTLTIAQLLTYIISATPTTDVIYTLPTGTLVDAGTSMDINYCFDWNIVNKSAFAITMQAGTTHSIDSFPTGGLIVNANSIATFRTTKTAVNTFISYRTA